MSCATKARRAGRSGTAAGITALGGRIGGRIGQMWGRLSDTAAALDERIGRQAAPAARIMLNLADDPRLVAAAGYVQSAVDLASLYATFRPDGAKALLAKAIGKSAGGLIAGVGTVQTAIRATGLVTQTGGNLVGELSRTAELGVVVQEQNRWLGLGRSLEPVQISRSRLTPLLNRSDAAGPGRTIRSSEGAIFKTGGATWHRGTVTVRLRNGRERTMTHLQSLKLPNRSYYFDRAITDEQAVRLAGGEINPRRLPGYVGQVSELESVLSSWGQARRYLIKTAIYYPAEGGP